MKKNLILTAAFGFGVPQLEFFIKSLRKYYTDDICFVIGIKDNAIEEELKKYNCIIIKKKINKKDIQLKRYEFFLEFLKDKDYNNVLCCDSRDIYFQANPFDFNYKDSINFFLEDQKIKDCPHNSNWIIKTYGKSGFNEVSNKTILCSGTVLGSLVKMREYLTLMKDKISTVKYKRALRYVLLLKRDPVARGSDQGHANYLVNTSHIKGCAFYSNSEGPVATVYYLKKIIFDEHSRLLSNNNKPYLIVHQYDKRWEEFSSPVNKFKKYLDID